MQNIFGLPTGEEVLAASKGGTTMARIVGTILDMQNANGSIAGAECLGDFSSETWSEAKKQLVKLRLETGRAKLVFRYWSRIHDRYMLID